MAEPARDKFRDVRAETEESRQTVGAPAVRESETMGQNAVHTVQDYAQAAIAEEAREAERWSLRASFAVIVGSSISLWALIGALVF